MKTQSADTDIQTEKVLIELVRKASPSQKFAQVNYMSGLVMGLSRRAIKRRNMHLNQDQLDVLFVRYHYGDDLADRLQEYLLKRKNAKSRYNNR